MALDCLVELLAFAEHKLILASLGTSPSGSHGVVCCTVYHVNEIRQSREINTTHPFIPSLRYAHPVLVTL